MPYTGKSSLALAARVSAVVVGVLYGSSKLTYLKAKEATVKKVASISSHEEESHSVAAAPAH